MQAEPQHQHRWLQKLIGEWTSEMEALMGPDKPPTKSRGSETVRPLGDLWVLCDGQGEMPDGKVGRMLMTLGYDPVKKGFVGTWIGSMMTHLWTYDGELDAAEKVLTLSARGPSMAGSGTANYRDVIEIVSDDHRMLKSYMEGDDGQWQQFMTAHYRRK